MEGKIREMFLQEPLKSQGLILIGMGSDKVVFETQGSTRKIVKVSSDILRWKVENLLAVENNQPIASEGVGNEYQKTLINTEKQEEKDAKEIFGEEHFLRRGVFRIKVPITKGFLRDFLGEHQKGLVEKLPDTYETEVEMLAETQLLAEELKDPERFRTKSLNTGVIMGNDFWKTKNIEAALLMARTFVESNFLSQVETLWQDKRYRAVLTEIVTKLIVYSKKTGLPADIFGPNNITVYEKPDGTVDYHMLDILMPGSYKNWGKKMSEDPDLQMLQHYYVYYYALNSAAKMLGVEENIKPGDLIYFKEQGIPTGDWPSEIDKVV